MSTTDPTGEPFEAYERDPGLLEPGKGVKRLPAKPGRLGGAVPVRFTEATLAAVKQFADEDHVTVSRWIRDAVDSAIDQRRNDSNIVYLDVAPSSGNEPPSRQAVEQAVRQNRLQAHNG